MPRAGCGVPNVRGTSVALAVSTIAVTAAAVAKPAWVIAVADKICSAFGAGSLPALGGNTAESGA